MNIGAIEILTYRMKRNNLKSVINFALSFSYYVTNSPDFPCVEFYSYLREENKRHKKVITWGLGDEPYRT